MWLLVGRWPRLRAVDCLWLWTITITITRNWQAGNPQSTQLTHQHQHRRRISTLCESAAWASWITRILQACCSMLAAAWAFRRRGPFILHLPQPQTRGLYGLTPFVLAPHCDEILCCMHQVRSRLCLLKVGQHGWVVERKQSNKCSGLCGS